MSHLQSLSMIALAVLLPLGACDLLGGDEDKESKDAPADEAEGKDADAKSDAADTPPKGGKSTAAVDPTLTSSGDGPRVTTPAVDPSAKTTMPVDPLPEGSRTHDEKNSITLFQAAAPATVFVTQTAIVEDMMMRSEEVPAGTGTGFIWDDEGHIVTNCHVALSDCKAGTKAPKLSVTFFDHKTLDAEVIGHDPTKDIAVLKVVPPEGIVAMRQPDEEYKLIVGQKAAAIGNPFGLDHTLTVGVVSALGREVRGIGDVTIRDMVQTDAAINPGNSGGPLLDSQGQLIGMNTMIFSRSGSSAGIGFAVPYTTIQRVVPQLIEHGRATRVGLGIKTLPNGTRFGVDGVPVEHVPRDTAAFKAGVRPPVKTTDGYQIDVIVGLDGERIEEFDDLYTALEGKKPGDTVKLQILRLADQPSGKPKEEVFEAEVELMELS